METHSLVDTINMGREYPQRNAHLRYFGGSTNHWGGACNPLRASDFEKRPWIPHSGWPFSLDDLKPYYTRAHQVLRLGDFNYDSAAIANSLKLSLFPFDATKIESVVARYNPLRLGTFYRGDLNRALNVTVYLYANVTSLNQHPNNHRVQDVSVRTLSGNRFTVRAKYFILATGGVENARLLLISNQVQQTGIGNQHDLVGRFFMEHIWYPSGIILPANQSTAVGVSDFYGKRHINGEKIEVRCSLTLPENVIRQQQIPDFRAGIDVVRTFGYSESVSSLRALYNALKKSDYPADFTNHVLNIIKDPASILGHLTSYNPPFVYRLNNFVEQVPNPESRVVLAPEKDVLGLNKAAINWQLSEIDKQGIQKAQNLIAAEMGRSGFGRMRIELPADENVLLNGAVGGAHHMGTTRMHVDPRFGVVDANCRIHGLKNIFIAGSSVFPTGGFANPTLTIVALAIKLADHMIGIMNRRFTES
jgi:choline dehydrogenase-like flavoprotein